MKRTTMLFCFCILIAGVMSPGCKEDSPSEPTPTGPTGSFSFNSDSGNFSSSGTYSLSATSGSGAGWLNSNTIAAYSISSATNLSVVVMMFSNTAVGTYQFPAQVSLAWSLNVNPTDTASVRARACTATGGSATITTNAGGIAQGSFSGTGAFARNPSQTMNITNGAFDIRSGTGKTGGLPSDVDRIASRLVQNMERR